MGIHVVSVMVWAFRYVYWANYMYIQGKTTLCRRSENALAHECVLILFVWRRLAPNRSDGTSIHAKRISRRV